MTTDPLQDIHNYSPTMTISQVLKFCEKKNLAITRGMVQNYIRDGLLPPPRNKRLYTHKHLAVLVLIARLKSVFDIPTIQAALHPYMDDEGIPIEVYASLINRLMSIAHEWEANIAPLAKVESDGGILLSMVFASELKAAIVG